MVPARPAEDCGGRAVIWAPLIASKIPWTEEPGRLQSMESQSGTRLSDFTYFTMRRH